MTVETLPEGKGRREEREKREGTEKEQLERRRRGRTQNKICHIIFGRVVSL